MKHGKQQEFYDPARHIRFAEEPAEWAQVGQRLMLADGLIGTIASAKHEPASVFIDVDSGKHYTINATTTIALMPLHERDTAKPHVLEVPSHQHVWRILQEEQWLPPAVEVKWRR